MALEAHELLFILVGQLTPVVRKLVTRRISEADWRFVGWGVVITNGGHPAWFE